jgi:YrbI family 3-deoxy-D-manno-octulosonate 8-phosphate phosphatase
MMERIVAVIPARGGSKGIPKKNIYPLAGKPLIAHTIDHARQSAQVSRVITSTDDGQIAEIARSCGAEVVMRPAEISGDAASSESALLHVLDHLRDTEGYEPDLVVFLQATSPLRRADDIDNAITLLREEKADSLFSASPVHGFVWRIDHKNEEGHRLRSLTYDYKSRQRRQDAPEDLIENGSIYLFKPWVIRQLNNRLGGKIVAYRMDALYSFQVDEPSDLELMEALLSARAPRNATPDMRGVQLLALDFDGVLTDNQVLVNEHGEEAVSCSRSDGWGIARLGEAGVQVIVISTEVNQVVAARCRKLGIACVQACEDKSAALQAEAAQRGLGPEQVAYVGNDVNDLECMRWAGFPIAVADAHSEALAVARLVTARRGGYGAVREVCDLILSQKSEM